MFVFRTSLSKTGGCLATLWVMSLLGLTPVFAQSHRPTGTGPQSRPQGSQPARPTSPAPETGSLSDTTGDQQVVHELRELVKAVQSLHENQQAQVAVSFLQVQQSRLDAVESKLLTSRNRVTLLKQQQQANHYRLENIQAELVNRNVLNQSEGERLIRADVEAVNGRLQGEMAEVEQQLAAQQEEYDRIKAEVEQITSHVWKYIRTGQPTEEGPGDKEKSKTENQ